MIYHENSLYIDDSHLEAFGENTARPLHPNNIVSGGRWAKQLNSHLHTIRDVHAQIQARWNGQLQPPEACEWLLDNWYLIQREGRTACETLRDTDLLRCSMDNIPILRILAYHLVQSGLGSVTETRCETFLIGFQHCCILSMDELSLLTTAIRAALVETLAAVCQDLEAETAPDQMNRLISSLRLLATRDFHDLLERIDHTEQILRQDPAGIYPVMDEKSRNQYRRQIARLSLAKGTPEYHIAEELLQLAKQGTSPRERHIGYFLHCAPLGQKQHGRDGGWYIAANVLLTFFFTLLFAFFTRSVLSAFLLLFPIWELVKTLLDTILLHLGTPTHIPRLELKDGIPEEGRTLCVISALLTSEQQARKLVERLEEYHLANRDCGRNLQFALLLDLMEADTAETPTDQKLLDAAQSAVFGLNARYQGGFYVLYRKRVQDLQSRRWTAKERKRGALMELSRMLCGKEHAILCAAGNPNALKNTRFILTLDADTRLSPGSARELVGAMLHPLNQPVVDENGIVREGFGILQPRIATELESTTETDFARISAGPGGTDAYGGDSSELYMDYFSCGGFSGKGIFDAAVFLDCLEGRIPDNRVLSHDALEGAFLHGGFVGDVELTDGCPVTVPSFYRRLHRWTRGDWQNLPWLFRRGHNLRDIDRWRLFDSLRRSLVTPFVFFSLFFALLFWQDHLKRTAVVALFAILLQLILTCIDSFAKKKREGRLHLHSAILHGVGGGLIRTAVQLLLLPYSAWISLSAIVTALWRMTVSHRNLLQWQTAAQSGGTRHSLAQNYRNLWFSVLSGIILLFSPSILGIAVGILWILAPAAAYTLGLSRTNASVPAEPERRYLIQCAKEIWRYFHNFCTETDHFLPPDNWQEQPFVGTAHRTSPTNIGLCLLCAVAANDLGIADRQESTTLVEHVLTTVEQLPKWHGHLYNWYNTQTLAILHPAYVSTVDSGNFAACLLALRESMNEYGRRDLADRADALFQAMDFSVLYDTSRHLFHIGFDADQQQLTLGWYDLMASEARLTGYVAIAKGDVDRKHWRKLSRAQVQKDGFRGMASWTGTMFEYLMPELLLPCYQDSAFYENSKFCLFVQKQRTAGFQMPWGISESAFYALDAALNYRYKAHGCSTLALKRDMDRELVISPYSTFLALPLEPRAALRNLHRLDRIGARGQYGFWEAVDFTPSRCRGTEFELVRCVMSHHLGMSLLSITNRLCNHIFPRRFLRDASMRAFAGLLQETVPLGGLVLRKQEPNLPEKPKRTPVENWHRHENDVDFFRSTGCTLSNGTYSLAVTESGVVVPHVNTLLPYRYPQQPAEPRQAEGLYLMEDGHLLSLLPDCGQPDTTWSWQFSAASAIFSAQTETVSVTSSLSVSASHNGELRTVTVHPADHDVHVCDVVFAFSPVLAPEQDYHNHPAFYKLGLHSDWKNGALLLHRIARKSLPDCWLCLACDSPLIISTDREQIPGRGGLAASLSELTETQTGWLNDPLICAKASLTIREGTQGSVRFALAFGFTRQEAYEAAFRILAEENKEMAALPTALSLLLGLIPQQVDIAMSLVPTLLFPLLPHPAAQTLESIPQEGKNGLWKFGISGDLPIVCADLSNREHLAAACVCIRQHALITACGLPFDLVFRTDDGGVYHRPKTNALLDCLREIGRESFFGAKGGVHIVPLLKESDSVLLAAAAVLDLAHPQSTPRNVERSLVAQDLTELPAQTLPHYHWNDDHSFSFTVSHSLPPRCWSTPLTNGRLGWFATDCASGHLWMENARECRITPWNNDPLNMTGLETLELVVDRSRRSLFAKPDSTDTTVTYAFGTAVWETQLPTGASVRVTAWIPMETDARVFLIESADLKEGHLVWQCPLVLSGDDRDAAQVITAFHDNILTAENPRCPIPDLRFLATASTPIRSFTTSRESWLSGMPDRKTGAGLDPCFSLSCEGSFPLVLVCGCCDDDVLRTLATPQAAAESLEHTRAYWRKRCLCITANSPVDHLNHIMNGWAVYQTLACRYLGRTSIYQSGGAMGFRDQLQDAANLVLVDPDILKQQLLLSAEHQFEEGDVQHWWHPVADGMDKGVRTRCSDDLLWLPWALCEYVEKTGDLSICDIERHYLHTNVLSAEEGDRYETPERSERSDTLLLHACHAVEAVLRRGHGKHGLLYMGNGDWNDGMDKVGKDGGESVWLSWFFSHTVHRLAALLDRLGNPGLAARYHDAAKQYGTAANAAWDGEWYLRGWFGNGTPLGSADSEACRIDSIAQSFAALCPEAESGRVHIALESAVSALFDREHKVIALFTPPFENCRNQPGYIESYGPGFRENGGQYTHGAIWLAMSCLRSGMVETGWEILQALLPANHPIDIYRAEPFVVAADVYTTDGKVGRAGWSWYTGSAGWLFRVIAEELFGLQLKNGKLYLLPRLPKSWDSFQLQFQWKQGPILQIAVSKNGITVNDLPYHGEGLVI
ncbi:MAG: GH36-type glycosyl hydrolase domain-containing protein [Oscillospiraceae bacterium]|jgi:cyclic beta-1,2-glucan synthetase